MKLYPLKFKPRLVPKMWGGRKLTDVLHKSLPPGDRPIGESWEIYDFPPGATGPDAMQPTDDPNGWVSAIVANGPLAGRSLHELMLEHQRELLGSAAAVQTPHGPQFPLLIKFLDARDDLSVQVHPPPDYAATHANAFVKNEAWHILQADGGARLLLGAKPGVTAERFRASLADGTTESLVHAVPVQRYETYYMPSGTLHALGGGIVAYEVQTPSDTTYRVYDFNRVDPSTRKTRTLHVEQAMQCIQWNLDAIKGRREKHEGDTLLARAPQWLLMQVQLSGTDTYFFAHDRAPIVATCIAGEGGAFASNDDTEVLELGETILLPPSSQTRVLPRGKCRLLLASVPPADVGDLRPK
jgi:mannose-6-phosphate isomerase